MTITLTFGTWMIPLIITIISAIIIFIAGNMKEDHWGFRGFMLFISIIAGGLATITAWIVWGVMLLLK